MVTPLGGCVSAYVIQTTAAAAEAKPTTKSIAMKKERNENCRHHEHRIHYPSGL